MSQRPRLAQHAKPRALWLRDSNLLPAKTMMALPDSLCCLAAAGAIDLATAVHRRAGANPRTLCTCANTGDAGHARCASASTSADADTRCASTNAGNAEPARCASCRSRPGHAAIRHARRRAVHRGLGRAGAQRNRRQHRQHRQGQTSTKPFCFFVRHFFISPFGRGLAMNGRSSHRRLSPNDGARESTSHEDGHGTDRPRDGTRDAMNMA